MNNFTNFLLAAVLGPIGCFRRPEAGQYLQRSRQREFQAASASQSRRSGESGEHLTDGQSEEGAGEGADECEEHTDRDELPVEGAGDDRC